MAATDGPSRPDGASPEMVLWDIVEQHLDETEFLLESFETALDDAEFTLDTLASGIERRLQAHLDGLRVGGPLVRERLLVPLLAEPDAGALARLIAAAIPLLLDGQPDRLRPALTHGSAPVRAAAGRACALVGGADLDRWVTHELSGPRPAATASGLLGYTAARGLAAPGPLFAWLQDADPALAAAAARAAGRGGDPRAHLPALEALLEHRDPIVQHEVMVAALIAGSNRAWAVCESAALAGGPSALKLYAALGGPAQHARIAERLAAPETRGDAVVALGFSGNVAMVAPLLERLRDEDPLVRRRAAQGISNIGGLPFDDDAFHMPSPARKQTPDPLPPPEEDPEAMAALPPLDEDDLDTPPVPAREASLPEPNPDAIEAWWAREAPRLDPRVRHLGGQPFSLAAVRAFLERAPLLQRHTIADALAVRTAGSALLDSRLFSHAQRARLRALGDLGPDALRGPVRGW